MAGKKTKVTRPAPPKKSPSAKATASAKLPVALAKRAEQQVAAKRDRLAKEARADIALIRRRQAEISEAFYDVGEALTRLKRPGVAEAIGRASFKEVCEKDLELSLATANRLITIVTQVPREDALRMGQQRAFALAELASATPEPDTAVQLDKAARKLPSGKKLDLSKASSNEILAAAKAVRRTRPGAKGRKGRTTTEEERDQAAALQSALRDAGLARARVQAVATKPGQPADVRIEALPLARLPELARAIRQKK